MRRSDTDAERTVQWLQVLGSITILAGFVLLQSGRITATSYAYLGLNTSGAVALCVTALVAEQWGFVLLEAVWMAASAAALVASYRRRRAAAATPAGGAFPTSPYTPTQ